MTEELAKAWFSKADRDIKTAKDELATVAPATDCVCFHCQQAVEKYFKGYLVMKKATFDRSHDLEYLKSLCANFNAAFSSLDIGDLTSYAVEVRYPETAYEPSFEEASTALRLAEGVKASVLQYISRTAG